MEKYSSQINLRPVAFMSSNYPVSAAFLGSLAARGLAVALASLSACSFNYNFLPTGGSATPVFSASVNTAGDRETDKPKDDPKKEGDEKDKGAPGKDQPALDKSRYIDLGILGQSLYFSGGVNYTPRFGEAGATGLFRYKRVTNYTFYDLQMFTFLVPNLTAGNDKHVAEDKDFNYYALARLKMSTKFFDWPWLYSWYLYSLKSSSEEGLNARAILESGYGLFLLDFKQDERKARLNTEIGIVFDYANLEAYQQNLSSGYFKGGMEFDFDLKYFFGKALVYVYYEMLNPFPGHYPDQSRVDVEANASRKLSPTTYVSVGSLFTRYTAISDKFRDELQGKLRETSLTVYMVVTNKNDF